MEFLRERKEIVKIAKKIYRKGLVTEFSGNISLRLNGNLILITPKSKEYEKIEKSDLVLIDLNGYVIEGKKEPSSEKKLHIEIYKNREDVNAIIHTHSICACVLAALEIPLPIILDEQTALIGGEIKVSKYAPSGSEELALEAVNALGKNKACIISKHGAVAVGGSINEAYFICNLIERLSTIYLLMKIINKRTH